MDTIFEQRLRAALRRAGKTEAERAARIGRTSRAIDEWEKGRGIAPLLKALEDAGVICILDREGTCGHRLPSQQPARDS